MLTPEQLNNPQRKEAVQKTMLNVQLAVILGILLYGSYNILFDRFSGLLASQLSRETYDIIHAVYIFGFVIWVWRVHILGKSIDAVEKINQKLAGEK